MLFCYSLSWESSSKYFTLIWWNNRTTLFVRFSPILFYYTVNVCRSYVKCKYFIFSLLCRQFLILIYIHSWLRRDKALHWICVQFFPTPSKNLNWISQSNASHASHGITHFVHHLKSQVWVTVGKKNLWFLAIFSNIACAMCIEPLENRQSPSNINISLGNCTLNTE